MVQRFTWLLLSIPSEPTPGITDHTYFDFSITSLLDGDGRPTQLGQTLIEVAERMVP